MARESQQLFDDLKRHVSDRGVEVRARNMNIETPGEFDGPSITINPRHDLQAACYYLVHSFGSICQWSTDFEHAKKVFENLRQGKTEPAIEAWRAFEQTSSEHAVWVKQDIGHAAAIPSYTVFFQATSRR